EEKTKIDLTKSEKKNDNASNTKEKENESKNKIGLNEENKKNEKELTEILKTKEEVTKDLDKEIFYKYIPTFDVNIDIVKKMLDIPSVSPKDEKTLFRLFDLKNMPLYDTSAVRTLETRWVWKLKKDDLPDDSYSVREYFQGLYEHILSIIPDYIMLRNMAVDNTRSKYNGKIVDKESLDIVNKLFVDDQIDNQIRLYISDMNHTTIARTNTIIYPAIMNPIDHEFNEYFLNAQLIEELNTGVIMNMIPRQLRADSNYNFALENSFNHTARYLPQLLMQDRIAIHEISSLWDSMTTANYVLARSVIPDLKDLLPADVQITEMAANLNLEALTTQVETAYLSGITTESANECFKVIIASLLSTRTISMSYSGNNYVSLFSGMYLLSVIPFNSMLRESVISLQLAIVNSILYPAFGLPQLTYTYLDQDTPFMIAQQTINNRRVREWLQHVNNFDFPRVNRDGVFVYTVPDRIRYGNIVNLFSETVTELANQQFRTYTLEYQRAIKRAIQLFVRRVPQILDLTRLMFYNYEVLLRMIVMSQQRVTTLTTEKLDLTRVTSLLFLISNTVVFPDPQSLMRYYSANRNFLNNYNERIDDTVARLYASNRLNLYRKKVLSIVTDFVRNLYIFEATKVPADQMYNLRDRLRRLPLENRRQRVFDIMMNNQDQIIHASDKIAHGVVLFRNERELINDEYEGLTNVVRNIDGNALSIEEIRNRGDYQPLIDSLLQTNSVALRGVIPFNTTHNPFELIAKVDVSIFAPVLKDRDINKLKPVKYAINSDSQSFYIVANNNWKPTSSTAVYKLQPRQFDFTQSLFQLTSIRSL
ncbi:VP2, partial [Rotavirus D]